MYNVKQQIYSYFDKTQKSHLCSFLRSFVKQNFRLTIDEIYDEFDNLDAGVKKWTSILAGVII